MILEYFAALRNGVDYRLRQWFHWRRHGLHITNEAKTKLVAKLPVAERQAATEKANRLKAAYHLDHLYTHSTLDNYRENLFYLEMLEKCLEIGAHSTPLTLPDSILAADIGPSHWFYVQALHAWLKWWRYPAGRSVTLEGYEADAWRVYADFYSRYDHALAHLEGLDNAQYLPAPFTAQPARFDLITLLFPFVFISDHLSWGLPHSSFDPDALLHAAWTSLKPGGVLVTVNQGEREHLAQQARWVDAEIRPAAAFRHDSSFYHYPIPRFVLVSVKNG